MFQSNDKKAQHRAYFFFRRLLFRLSHCAQRNFVPDHFVFITYTKSLAKAAFKSRRPRSRKIISKNNIIKINIITHFSFIVMSARHAQTVCANRNLTTLKSEITFRNGFHFVFMEKNFYRKLLEK